MKNYALTNEEIVQHWGSLEEYLEEQRRMGLYAFETQQFEESHKPGYKVTGPGGGRNGLSNPVNSQPKAGSRFHLGWHRA